MKTSHVQENSSHDSLIIESSVGVLIQYGKRLDNSQIVYPSYDCPLNQHDRGAISYLVSYSGQRAGIR
jgi:hypothetical protein